MYIIFILNSICLIQSFKWGTQGIVFHYFLHTFVPLHDHSFSRRGNSQQILELCWVKTWDFFLFVLLSLVFSLLQWIKLHCNPCVSAGNHRHRHHVSPEGVCASLRGVFTAALHHRSPKPQVSTNLLRNTVKRVSFCLKADRVTFWNGCFLNCVSLTRVLQKNGLIS